MRIRSLILPLLLVSPFAAAGNLECNRETPLEYVPTTYRCVYHNGSLSQAYAAMRTNRFEDGRLRFDFPGMPRRLPANNFQYRGNVRFDLHGNGRSERYLAQTSIKYSSPDSVMIKYLYEDRNNSIYTHEALFQRKGSDVEITSELVAAP